MKYHNLKESLELEDDSTNTTKQRRMYWITFVLFLFLGSGANWVFSTALAEEIPYFEQHFPRGLCVGTYMNAANNFGTFVVLLYAVYTFFYPPFPHRYAVPGLILCGVFGGFFVAGTFATLVHGIPVFLLIGCAIGGLVGAMSGVIFNPFLSRYESDFISASRAGESVGKVLTAVVAMYQNPGAVKCRLNPSFYFLIFGCFALLGLLSYFLISRYQLGLRHNDQGIEASQTKISAQNRSNESEDGEEGSGSGGNESAQEMKEIGCSARVLTGKVASMRFVDSHDSRNRSEYSRIDEENDVELSPVQSQYGFELTTVSQAKGVANIDDQPIDSSYSGSSGVELGSIDNRLMEPCRTTVSTVSNLQINSRSAFSLLTVWPYLLAVGWIDFNTWGLLSALIPFAVAEVSSVQRNARNLALAYQISSLVMVFGDLSTTRFQLPLQLGLILFSALVGTIYLCAAGAIHDSSGRLAPLVVVTFVVSRFLEAHLLTSCYRRVAEQVICVSDRETAARALGISDQIFTTLGAILSTTLVSKYAAC